MRDLKAFRKKKATHRLHKATMIKKSNLKSNQVHPFSQSKSKNLLQVSISSKDALYFKKNTMNSKQLLNMYILKYYKSKPTSLIQSVDSSSLMICLNNLVTMKDRVEKKRFITAHNMKIFILFSISKGNCHSNRKIMSFFGRQI